ncbi:MAG: TfoX/Sxy family protein [Legionellales bacterium]|nr:TfoX/Sxy family protein [Legionellales bacterium]
MSKKQSTVDFILEQLEGVGILAAKKMFGEYGLYCDGKIVALICDNQLFVKPTQAGKSFINHFVEDYPYPGAKPYLLVTGDLWENSQWLSTLIRISADELPLPKPKLKKQSKKVLC